MGGFGLGVILGLFVSGIVLTAMSLSSPLPPRPGVDAPQLEVTVSGDGDEAAAEAEAEAEADEGADAAPETGDANAGDGEAAAPEAGEDAEQEAPAEEDPVEIAPSEEAPVEDAPTEEAPTDEAPAEEATPDAEAAPETDVEESGNADPATDIPLPSGSEFNRPPPEEVAALPAPDAALNAAAPQAPQLVARAPSPLLDTSPASRPAVSTITPRTISVVPTVREAASVASGASDSDPAGAAPRILSQPSASDVPQIVTAPTPPPVPEPTVEEVAEAEVIAPEASDEGVTPGVDIAALDAAAPETPALTTPNFPIIIGEAAPEIPAQAPADVPAPRLPQISRLPQAGNVVLDELGAADAEDEVAEEVPETPAEDLPAIVANAATFDPQEERPLMAVVLIDDPDSTLELDALTRFSFPVAFAIDALHPEAADRAATYRAAGYEVVMLGSMVIDGATAADAEVAIAGAQVVLPEAVALMDTPEHRIQGDRAVLDTTVAALAQTGHGLLAFPRGLNAAEATAARADVPGVTVFRLIDAEGEAATMITRSLSRAAFAASQEGHVVVVGHTRPDTVTALLSWSLGDRSEGVALAPVSATLLRSVAD